MRRVFKGLLTLVMLCSFGLVAACCTSTTCCPTTCCTTSCGSCCDDCTCLGPCDGAAFLLPRSQGFNAARELVGWQPFINKYDMDSYYGAFYAAVEYTRTFKEEDLAGYFFGRDLVGCNSLMIQGSEVENRCCNAWLADYFGLPRDFNSKVSFCPRIQNAIVDLNWYQGLDEWTEGLFFRMHAPIVWTKWELRMCECVVNAGTDELGFFPEGYMSADKIEKSALACSFTQAIGGCHTWGDMKCPIKYGLMSNCCQTKTRLADLRFALGYNFVRKEDGHFGVLLHLAAPTGNKPCATYLFEPIAGNGKHWELGGGITSSWIFWRSEENEDRYAGFWMDANITHLFKKCQCRSFDFCCRPNSRYMLLEQMEANPEDGEQIKGGPDAGNLTIANYRYAKALIPAINWSTFNVDVKIDVQADIALKLGWVRENWSFDLGYNLWARTGERFCDDCCDDCCDTSCCTTSCCGPCGLYAIKGDSFVYGYQDLQGNATVAKPLSATQNCADIHAGKNGTTTPDLNLLVDNAVRAFDENDTRLMPYLTSGLPTTTVRTSIQPNLVSKCDLALCKGPSAITHKLFANFSYAWKDREDEWVPFLGIGGEVEWAQGMDNCCCDSNCCDTSCCSPCGTSCCPTTCCDTSCCSTSCCNNDCCDTKRAGISQWGVWIKGGLAFD